MSKVVLAPPKTDDIVTSHTATWSDEKKAEFASYIETQKLDYEPTVSAGDHVIVKTRKSSSFFTIRSGANQKLKVKNIAAPLDRIIEQPYHAAFNQEGKRKRQSIFSDEGLFEHLDNINNDEGFIPTANNAELFDNNENQTLTQADILKMKEEGKSSDEIIKAVALSSKTFLTKTEYSQKKWLRKKLAKHSHDFTLYRPTIASILATITEREPRKALHMRDDTMAQLLQYANVGANNNTLVVETASGLITGAVAQRQGGFGKVLSGHLSHQPTINLIDEYNLTSAEKSSITPFPLGILSGVSKLKAQGKDTDAILQHFHAQYMANKQAAIAAKGNTVDPADISLTLFQQQQQDARAMLATGLDSLILATHYDPLSLLLALLPFLRPSSPIVVYCETIEPLSRAVHHLIANKLAANVQLSESWYRKYTIAPNISHPEMSMPQASSGYILTGFTVAQ